MRMTVKGINMTALGANPIKHFNVLKMLIQSIATAM